MPSKQRTIDFRKHSTRKTDAKNESITYRKTLLVILILKMEVMLLRNYVIRR